MNTSESITKLSAALLKAQRSIKFAEKNAKNDHFRNRYADLSAVIDAIKPALNEAGIAFLQLPAPSEPGTLALTTRLLHESGEWLESTAVTPLQKNDPQGYGSAITYLRRYSLAAAVGLYQDDDDGHAASQPKRTGVMADVLSTLPPLPAEEAQYLDELADQVKDVFKKRGAEEAYERIAIENLTSEQKLYLSSNLPSDVRNPIKAVSLKRNQVKKAA